MMEEEEEGLEPQAAKSLKSQEGIKSNAQSRGFGF